MNIKCQGIIIRRFDLGEADRILTIFTERLGKIKAIAKGVRKISSKLAGNLEPFNVIGLELHQGKTFYTVTGAVILESFSSDKKSELSDFSRFNYLSELIDKLFEENDRHERAFELFVKTIEYISSKSDSSHNTDLILRIFELKILEESGFKPEIYNCLHCKKNLKPSENFWDKIEGGIICAKCQGQYHHGKKISDEVIKLFRLIEKNDIDLAYKLKMRRIFEIEAETILNEYILSILEQNLKSREFLKLVERRN